MSLRILERDLEEDLAHVRAELARRSFARFVRMAWPYIDPTPLVWNWHLDAMCEHLQAVTEGRVRRLVINIPPGHAKSMVVSVLWPAWAWAKDPAKQFLTASYGIDLATRDAVKTRTLLETEWFKELFGRGWALKTDQNVKSFYQNTVGGHRLCLSPTGKGTGWRGDVLVIDDPLNAQEAPSKLARDEVVRWKTETMSSRFNDAAGAAEVLVMQRLHEDDLSGFLLASGQWEHLRLPSEFDIAPACRCQSCTTGRTSIGWSDPRTKEGELLFPVKFPTEVLATLKTPGAGMGPLAYAGQHQQRPAPPGGNLIKREWLENVWARAGEASAKRRVYRPEDREVQRTRFIMTDAAFKDAEENDRVAIGVIDIVGPDAYLVDQRWGHLGFGATVAAILDLHQRWPSITAVCVEDRANGPAIIETLKQKIPGVTPIEPEGSKEARVSAAAEFIAANNLWLPEGHPQLDDMRAEAMSFPKGRHDDWIDMIAYALIRGLLRNDLSRFDGMARL